MSIKYRVLSVVLLLLLTSCITRDKNAEDAEDIKMQNLSQINGTFKNLATNFFHDRRNNAYLSMLVLPDATKDEAYMEEKAKGIEYIKATNLDNRHIKVEALNKQFQLIESKTYTLGQDFKFEDGEIVIRSETKLVTPNIIGVDYLSYHFVLNDKNNLLYKINSGGAGLAMGIIPAIGHKTTYIQFDRVK